MSVGTAVVMTAALSGCGSSPSPGSSAVGGDSGETHVMSRSGDSAGGHGATDDGSDGATHGGESQLLRGIPKVDESDLAEPVDEVGFIELEPRHYEGLLTPPQPWATTRTRLFYRFIAADDGAKHKPLFVFFNGGPGYTSMLLYTFGTGRLTLNAAQPDQPPVENPHSFTALGSLLYIDARQTGFSYGVAGDAADDVERASAFGKMQDSPNFNPIADAADFVQVVLRVMARQPALQNNQVILVGESYGGARANWMLSFLLYPDGPLLRGDEALEAEIASHYQRVFVGVERDLWGPELFARQFGWQVLIQPYVVGRFQGNHSSQLRNDRLENAAAEHGITTVELEAQYCYSDISRPLAYCDAIDPAIARTLLDPESFETWMGAPPEDVPGLPASDRIGGFRIAALPSKAPSDPPSFVARAGELEAWDRYFAWFPLGQHRFDIESPSYGGAFLFSARYANTLITNASLDVTVLSEAIVPALQELAMVYAPWLEAAEYVGDDPDEPSERIRLRYGVHPIYGSGAERTIHFPTYAAAGHMLTLTQPDKLLADVRAFFAETAPAPEE